MPSYHQIPMEKCSVVMLQLPKGPWESIAIDFYGPIPYGCHILVAKDQYSWFPVCEFVKSTSVHNTIPNLEKTFADYGNPKTVTSDNGPPNSQTFKDLATNEGFYHHWISHNIHSPTLGNVSWKTLIKLYKFQPTTVKIQSKLYIVIWKIIALHLTLPYKQAWLLLCFRAHNTTLIYQN